MGNNTKSIGKMQEVLYGGALPVLLLVVAILYTSSFAAERVRKPIASSETNFVEVSAHGLGILPASCASSPQYFHYHLATALGGNNFGFVSRPGETDYGESLSASLQYLCVTNTSGLQYFIPANTTAEINAFKAAPALPGLQKW